MSEERPSLIKGRWYRLNLNPFTNRILKKPSMGGVYALYCNGRLQYIGESKNLAKRIQEISQTPVTVTSPSGKERHLDDEDGLFGLSPSTKSSQSDRGKNLAAIPFPDLKDPSF